MEHIQKLLYILFLILLPTFLQAQYTVSIEGKITEKITGEAIPYAKVYNQTQHKGTLSNEDGYFKLSVRDYADSVVVRVIGFKSAVLKLNATTTFYEVVLEENAQLLGEVTVRPEDNSYLYELMQDCRKNSTGASTGSASVSRMEEAKVYYELKSTVENKQIELVENFYNGSIYGYDLEELKLKTGRFALQDFDKTFFGSHESSKAIVMLKLFKSNDYFPISPFELSGKKLRQQFYLHLHSRYRDDKDSIYVVDFVPRDKTGNYFTGRVWINPKAKTILQTELHCEHALRHPFLPIFPNDTIRNLDLHITKSFQEVNGKMCFRHIDFSYETTYKNRSNTTYKTSTKAILYAYDFGHAFTLPKFRFAEASDFKKISAVPYNAYFWQNHEELTLSDEKDQNQSYFNDVRSTTNRGIFAQGKFSHGIFESPYLTWGGKRIRFREFAADTTENTNYVRGAVIISELYNLNAKIYLDINPFLDTLQIVTTTVFDPYESYYKLPLDNAALYFINVYFDLVELERRKLESEILQSDRKLETIDKLYAESEKRIAAMQLKYFKEADHGKSERGMAKWNQVIVDGLKIDNLLLLNPYLKE